MRHALRSHIDYNVIITALLVFLIVISVSFYCIFYYYLDYFLVDILVYARAINDYSNGRDAYRIDAHLPFVYAPIVLNILDIVSAAGPIKYIFGGLYAVSTAWFVLQFYLLVKHAQPNNMNIARDSLIVFMSAFAFAGIGIPAFSTGNVSVFMHFAMVGLIFKYARQRQVIVLITYGLIIVLCAIVKPYFIAYTLFYFFALKWNKAALSAAVIAVIVSIVLFLSLYFQPAEFAQFIAALKYQSITKRDFGYSMFGIMRNHLNENLSICVHLAGSAIILCLLFVCARAKCGIGTNNYLLAIIMIPVIIIVNPRMKEYDSFIGILSLFIFLMLKEPASYVKLLFTAVFLSIIPAAVVILRIVSNEPPGVLFRGYRWQYLALMVVGTWFAFINRSSLANRAVTESPRLDSV